MKGALALIGAIVALGSVGVAGAEVNAVTPSTNDINKANGWAYVDVSTGFKSATLTFHSTRSFQSCFEYRTDGDTSQVLDENGGQNYNTAVTDGLYPYVCVNNSTKDVTVSAKQYVEVRMVFGAESDERFDWTRFDVGKNNSASVIYDSTAVSGPPSNLPSLGAEAYAFASLGDEITFADGPRNLTNVVVTLSSWACVSGTWYGKDCSTPTGATFSQPITLTIYDAANLTTPLASATQTFDVPYRPSASSKCTGTDAGKWYSNPLKTCFNGYATDVAFSFGGNVTLPDKVVYAISYNTSHYGPEPTGVPGPYDSLNIALNTSASVGTDVVRDEVWQDGVATTEYGDTYTPAVQFKAGGGS